MHQIPRPELLDPDRLLLDSRDDMTADEHANRAALLDQALHESCGYAQQLWQSLDAVRGYLLDSLPPDPRSYDEPVRRSAAPAGPDDEAGWQNWMAAYAAVTSVLAGPHGDSGFGSDEAQREARDRRLVLAQHPAPDSPAGGSDPAPATGAAPGTQAIAASESGPALGRHAAPARSPLRIAARVAVLLLAVRGLRRR